MNKKYTPVPCAFYDELEAAVVKKLNCEIIYLENEEEKIINSKVIDLKNIQKEEFMILENNQQIRLDFILFFNGISPKDKNYC
ncbi:transcriptional antiterminator Rof [Halarcobacter bivalviorum]|uniref:transcriptional antiterminator Rof n=1 Tax=Halarcobacter bivalviorum TaxID=663364 RepID=UPI00100A66E8|nr:transcriptional antiterminator Rof [Halarcobacter bivalviorum]RXK06663.1 transcriptional antiterminator Rof [Halarcobacter bivalviorum]